MPPLYTGGRRPRLSAKSALPPEFLARLEVLEAGYLAESDPLRQSGFSGGRERWRVERAPILEALSDDGELLDVGCANGYLLESLLAWSGVRGLRLTPFGVDCSAGLVALARERLPAFRAHFFVGNAWDWCPPRRFRYVYAVWDCVPPDYFAAFVEHLLAHATAPGGRLIIGAYGSRARNERPARIEALLSAAGHAVQGSVSAGVPETARFAWITAP
jgi:SAM-dependent methyltransferase